jgi:hypothetical protein
MKEIIVQPKDKDQMIALESMFKAFGIDFRIQESGDFWDNLPAELKGLIENSQKEIDEGKYLTLDEVKKHFSQK